MSLLPAVLPGAARGAFAGFAADAGGHPVATGRDGAVSVDAVSAEGADAGADAVAVAGPVAVAVAVAVAVPVADPVAVAVAEGGAGAIAGDADAVAVVGSPIISFATTKSPSTTTSPATMATITRGPI